MVIYIYNLQKEIKIKTQILKALTRKLCRILKLKKGIVSIVLTDNKNISLINAEYLGRKTSTDVLSFNMLDSFDDFQVHGEIVVSLEKASENAILFKNEFSNEVILYIVHGLLHLIGYNDITKAQKIIMRKEERRLLNLLNKTKNKIFIKLLQLNS